jgi:chorismate synthase
MVLERSSARETAARVAAGALVRQMLNGFGIGIFSHVVRWGEISVDTSGMNFRAIREKAEQSDLRSACDQSTEDRIRKMIDQARQDGNTLGGVVEVVIAPVPPFLGSYQNSFEKLDSRLAATALSVQAVKGVEFGLGFQYGSRTGKETHDEIFFDRKKNSYYRQTNHAGGIEGGMSNGSPIVFRAVMKPIPTLMSPLRTVQIDTKASETAATERSDVAAVAACGVVIENAVAVDIANALLARYGGDDLDLVRKNFDGDPALADFDWRSDHA